jgi:hypothetical protein
MVAWAISLNKAGHPAWEGEAPVEPDASLGTWLGGSLALPNEPIRAERTHSRRANPFAPSEPIRAERTQSRRTNSIAPNEPNDVAPNEPNDAAPNEANDAAPNEAKVS